LSLSRDSKIGFLSAGYEKRRKRCRVQATAGGIVITISGVN
jgi:hypothetical protein